MKRWFMYCLTLLLSMFRNSEWHGRWRCEYDAHDYIDWEVPQPQHFCKLPCKRCGKEFGI